MSPLRRLRDMKKRGKVPSSARLGSSAGAWTSHRKLEVIGFAIALALAGYAALVDASPLQLLVFISIVAVTGLAISAVVGERQRAMEELGKSRDELEQRVVERTQSFRRSEEIFRLLVEGIQDYAIFMLDPDGNIASWNKGAEKIKGYQGGEIIGQHFSRFYPPEALARDWPRQELEFAKAQGRCEDEGWRLRKDGTKFWANVIITAIYDAAGGLRGFAKVTRDMSERKRIEALEHGEQRMNEFLAMLAHELRNPLAPIRNALDLMRMKSASDATQEWSRNVIDRQVTQMTRLVDDLLDIGRITSGKIALKKEPVELNGAVLHAVESCHALADARRQTLDVQCTTDPLLIDGDPVRLSQIVLNLLNNAIKYTPDGGRIAASVARESEWAVVRVKDTGIGIPAELLPNVFDLFTQGERSLARTEGGLGIGLTIVRQLVALHGGTVVARSEGPDRGSEFIVRLPALAKKLLAGGSSTNWQPSKPQTKRRVLIVDDNHDSADMLGALLGAWGHDVRAVYDGPSAIAAAVDYHPDIVLLDIGLPGMNGYEVAKQLRMTMHLQPVVLVAFTGYGQDEDRRRAHEAGFDHHLVKPVEPATLEKIIESIPTSAASQ